MTGLSGAVSTFHTADTNELLVSSSDASRADSVWFAVQTWPRYEKRVASELKSKRIEVFLPLLRDKHKWSDRERTVELPLFPGYLFVRTREALDARIPVLRTNGVMNFLGVRGTGSPVPESEIESVRLLLNRHISFHAHPFLNVGQRVRIRSGSLQGVEGILVEKNDDLSLVVSVQIIQRSLAIRLAGYQIEAA